MYRKNKICIKHNVNCEATSYSSRASVHSRKDWRAEADSRFRESEYEDRINANFDAYKKWGIGDDRFFIISDNKDDPTQSSHTFYFYLNVSNMPRLLGVTFYSADTNEVKKYEFKYDDSDSFSTEFVGRRELKKKYKYTSKYKKSDVIKTLCTRSSPHSHKPDVAACDDSQGGAEMMRRALITWPGFMLLVTISGCIPLAWVVPPAKLDVGVGVTDRSRGVVDPDVPEQGRHGALDVRGSLEPLSAIPSFEHRIIDVSAGYGLRYTKARRYRTHGPFLGLTALIPLGHESPRRITLGTQLHALTSQGAPRYALVGNRVTGRVGFELFQWKARAFSNCESDSCGSGYMVGELGVSPYTELSRTQISRRTEWAWTFGLTVRIPAVVGAGVSALDPGTLL